MTEPLDIQSVELSDEQLITVLKNHGMSRRWLMRLFGTGAVLATLGGTAAARPLGDAKINAVYGAPYEASETVPRGIAAEEVHLHLHEGQTHPTIPAPNFGAEFYFDPVGVHLRSTQVIDFAIHNGLHTVTSIHPKFNEVPFLVFPDRVPTANGFTSPVMNTEDSWLYRFTTPGVYDIMCLPHYELGMVCRVVVTGPNGEVPTDDYDDSLLPPAPAAVLNAPELSPQYIVDAGTVAWDELTI